jgi:hypothetical protein
MYVHTSPHARYCICDWPKSDNSVTTYLESAVNHDRPAGMHTGSGCNPLLLVLEIAM